MRIPRSAFFRRVVLMGGGLLLALPTEAHPFRVTQMPNGAVFNCQTCHVAAAGGGPRNAFGAAVFAITGTSARAFWTPTLAAKDSDGDGFTNGQELGDPTGSGTATPGAKVTNPGDAKSHPAVNVPPSVALSSPTDNTVIQLPATVTISATVSDSDGTVAKVEFFDGATLLGTLTAGPYQWVGTLAAGPHTLTARATDNLGAGTTSTAVNITVNSASSPIVLGQPVRGADGTTLTLNWSGGTGPYAVQTQAAAGGAWQDLTVTVAPGPVAAALTGTSGNFRVADLANFVGTPADVQLTGAAVRPTPVGGAGTGSGTWSVNLSTLNLDLTYTGLSGSLSGVTLRGPATTNEVGAVLLDLGALAGVAGHVNGQVALTTEQKAWVLGGQTYLSIQTAAHPEGEIRGQLIR